MGRNRTAICIEDQGIDHDEPGNELLKLTGSG